MGKAITHLVYGSAPPLCSHDYEELIDPKSGGFIRCRLCGHEIDCEDPDGEENWL